MAALDLVEAESTGFCAGCGCPFLSFDPRQTLCRPGCSRGRTNLSRNGARDQRRASGAREFIGVDGEGCEIDGEHRYVLLSIGDESYHMDGERLTTQFVFESLWAEYLKHPNAIFVGFALGYDWSQWWQDLPMERADMLAHPEKRARTRSGGNHRPFPVRWDKYGWQFDALPGRRFSLHKGLEHKHPGTWMYVCDTYSFWQSSFLKAIDPKGWDEPVCTPEEYEIILEGKSSRRVAVFGEEMMRYNVMENRILSRLMARLQSGFIKMGVRLNRKCWYGPGQAAQKWMNNIGTPKGVQVQKVTPFEVYAAATESYYGGWFEITAHGHIPGTTYEYDINSAYPSIIRNLPCLLHGKWVKEGKRPKPAPYQLVYGTFEGNSRRLGPHMHRDRHGNIRRTDTKGWAWRHELEASKRCGLLASMKILGAFTYHPCDCPPPMREIETLYQDRLKVGKSTPNGKALKLVYNSSYGKCAQSVGEANYANPIYASLITTGCRTQILDAIATHPMRVSGVLMVATDAVYFRKPHPGLPISNKLGEWDMQEKENLTLFMPGVYWDDKAREAIKNGGSPSLKSRGVSARHLAQVIEKVDKLWDEWTPDKVFWPQVDITIDFTVISAGQALNRRDWSLCGKVLHNETRTLSSEPSSKRNPHSIKRWASPYEYNYAWISDRWYMPTFMVEPSTPYAKRLGAKDVENSVSAILTVDGPLEWQELLAMKS